MKGAAAVEQGGDWRVLSLTQPYAQLVVLGCKQWETRSWATKYRGWTFIHASASYPRWARMMTGGAHFASALAAHELQGPEDLPLGAVVGAVRITDCRRVEDARHLIGTRERAFGDYTAGRFAWRLEDAIRFPAPIPHKGGLGLRRASPELIAEAVRLLLAEQQAKLVKFAMERLLAV